MRLKRSNVLAWLLGFGVAFSAVEVLPIAAQSEVGESDKEAEADRILQEGIQLFQEGTAESLRSAIPKLEEAARLYREVGNLGQEAFALLEMGSIQDRLGENQAALEHYDHALELYQEVGDRDGEAQTLGKIGEVYSNLGEKQRALDFFERALLLYRAMDDGSGKARTLNNIGTIYSDLGDKQRALEFYERSLPLRQAVGDRRGEANTLSNIGTIYADLGDRQRALEYYERALPLFQAVGDRRGEAVTLGHIGQVYFKLGEWQRALDFHERALPIRREVNDRRGEADALNHIGWIESILGKKQRALELFEQSLLLRRAVRDSRGEANTFASIGMLYLNLGEKRKAVEYLKKALLLFRAESEPREKAGILAAIGQAYSDFGEKQQALEYLEQALLSFRAIRDRRGEAYTLSNLSLLYSSLGERQRAVKYLEQAFPLFHEVNDHRGKATALNNLGRVYNELGKKRQALEFLKQALPLFRESGERRGEVYALNNIGAIYFDLGEKQQALEYLKQALPLFRELGDRAGEGHTLNNLGKVYQDLGETKRALEFLEKALSLLHATGDRDVEALTLFNIAFLQRSERDLQQALSTIEESLALTEDLRANLDDPDLKTSFFADRQSRYEFYIDLLMELHQQNPDAGYDALALHATERSRARTLVELLQESTIDIRQGIPPELLQREDKLKREIDRLERDRIQLAREDSSQKDRLQEVLDEIADRLQDLEELATTIRRASPAYADLEYPEPLELKDIQQRVLDEETVLLQYSLGAERSFLFLVTQDSLQTYILPPRAEIEAAAITFAETLRRKNTRDDWGKIRIDSHAIAHLVLDPIRDRFANDLQDKRLLIVADGALHDIPFAAFSLNPDAYEPLVRDFEIVNSPSATVLATLRKTMANREARENAIAILADPVFGEDDRTSQRNASNVYLEANANRFDIPLPPRHLPWTRDEANAILALTPDDKEFAAFDFDASVETAKSPNIANHRIVHFATHGFADHSNPALSGILLSLLDENQQSVNGFLRLNDIFNLTVPAELVVLSACQTGVGKNVRGEGLVGLTRGFMYAGSPRLVLSLWNVDDKGTAALMARFYEKHLKEGLTPAKALRQAQLDMFDRSDPESEYKYPYYWSAFVVQGEWQNN